MSECLMWSRSRNWPLRPQIFSRFLYYLLICVTNVIFFSPITAVPVSQNNDGDISPKVMPSLSFLLEH